jgi:hypothetical protein
MLCASPMRLRHSALSSSRSSPADWDSSSPPTPCRVSAGQPSSPNCTPASRISLSSSSEIPAILALPRSPQPLKPQLPVSRKLEPATSMAPGFASFLGLSPWVSCSTSPARCSPSPSSRQPDPPIPAPVPAPFCAKLPLHPQCEPNHTWEAYHCVRLALSGWASLTRYHMRKSGWSHT